MFTRFSERVIVITVQFSSLPFGLGVDWYQYTCGVCRWFGTGFVWPGARCCRVVATANCNIVNAPSWGMSLDVVFDTIITFTYAPTHTKQYNCNLTNNLTNHILLYMHEKAW